MDLIIEIVSHFSLHQVPEMELMSKFNITFYITKHVILTARQILNKHELVI